jgi:hypothetical protein
MLEEAADYFYDAGIEVVRSFEEVVARAHVYAVDNSSTLFEFAALDRPVVLLNAKAYRRSATFGLRFWSEADIGIQAEPGEMATALLAALEDPDDVARSREAALDRVYPVRDGTSALRAATAIVSLVAPGRPCLVCGAANCACGGPTEIIPIDQRVKEKDRMGTLKWYDNPARPGARMKLSDAAATRMGLLPKDGKTTTKHTPPPPDITNPGGDPLVSSTTAEPLTPLAATAPAGAMTPSGVTRRARAAKAATGAAADGDDAEEKKTDEADVKDKKRPAPSRRRRAAATPEG